jgi:DNA invertase Pin-like site-specific DNA recombinase
MKAISYLRVSTRGQGVSGLGLDAQRTAIASFLSDKGAELVAEYMDVESGSRNGRKGLEDAIAYAKKTGALLVIAKLDRISRRVSFIAQLLESGVKFAIAELPNATEFQIHIYSAMAQEERRLISERTRQALEAAKRRGIELGANGKALSVKNKTSAVTFAQSIKDVLIELREAGLSFKEIATELNNRNIASFTGGIWYGMTIKRAYQRIV